MARHVTKDDVHPLHDEMIEIDAIRPCADAIAMIGVRGNSQRARYHGIIHGYRAALNSFVSIACPNFPSTSSTQGCHRRRTDIFLSAPSLCAVVADERPLSGTRSLVGEAGLHHNRPGRAFAIADLPTASP